jgi:hypothetical protein
MQRGSVGRRRRADQPRRRELGPFWAPAKIGPGGLAPIRATSDRSRLPNRVVIPMKFSTTPPRLADSAVGAAINALINGAIAWFAFRSAASVPMSVDSIAAPGVTALGNAATAAFSLVLIITCITFFVFRSGARKAPGAPEAVRTLPFLPTGLRIALANTLLVFGAFVAAAVMWQRLVGTVELGPVAAAIVVGLVAGVATAFAEWRTKREMLAASPGR